PAQNQRKARGSAAASRLWISPATVPAVAGENGWSLPPRRGSPGRCDDEGTGPAIAEVGDAERSQPFEERGIEVPSGRVRLAVGTRARRHPRRDDPRAGSRRLPGQGLVADGHGDAAGGESESGAGPGDATADDADAGCAVDGACWCAGHDAPPRAGPHNDGCRLSEMSLRPAGGVSRRQRENAPLQRGVLALSVRGVYFRASMT